MFYICPMKIIIKIFPYLLCLVSYFSYAQDLTIASGGSLTVLSGTDFYVNGINFNPTNSNLTLAGPIDFSRTATPVGESIDRVFNFSNPITSFQGDLTFFYEEDDLNGMPDTNLVLQVKNDLNVWNSYGTVEPTGNTISYTFESSIDFSTVTASASGVTLSISKYNKLDITVFPNPVISELRISTNLTIESLIYNLLGQEILRTKQKNIDVSHLSAGNYLIIVKDLNNNNFNSYHIIKL